MIQEDALSYHSSFECVEDNDSVNEDAVNEILLLDFDHEPDQLSAVEMPKIITYDQESQTVVLKPESQPLWI